MSDELLRAAELLEDDADALFASHTVNGKWRIHCPADGRAKRECEERRALAAVLRQKAALSDNDREDAERYRWLRNYPDWDCFTDEFILHTLGIYGGQDKELDAAIDTARAQEVKG